LTDGHLLLLLQDESVLLLGFIALQALPRQGASEEIYKYVRDRFEVIATTLLDAQMVVDRRIAWGAGQGAIVALENVAHGFWVTVSLGQAEVDAEHLICATPHTNHEICLEFSTEIEQKVEENLVKHGQIQVEM
jgi:hypothetical protein